MARDRLADGFAQLARVIGERFGTDLGQRVIVRQAQVSEDERPQLIIEPGTGLAFPIEVIEAGEQRDVVLREEPQRPVPTRMLVTDRFAAIRDSAPRTQRQSRFVTTGHIAQLAAGFGDKAASALMSEQGLQVEVVEPHATDDDSLTGGHLGDGGLRGQALRKVEPAIALGERGQAGAFLRLGARDVADGEHDSAGDDRRAILAAHELFGDRGP